VSKNQKPLTNVEMELARIKRELAEVKMERDSLTAAYFAKESRLKVLSHERMATVVPRQRKQARWLPITRCLYTAIL